MPVSDFEVTPNLEDPTYRSTLVELLANQMVGEALAADALTPHLGRCPDLETRYHLTLIMHQEAGHGYMLGRLLEELGEDANAHFQRLIAKGYPPYHVEMMAQTAWTDVVVGLFLVDPTGIAFIHANAEANYRPLRQVCARILKEERFHVEFAQRHFRRVCDTEEGRHHCQSAVDRWFPITLKILGKPDSPRGRIYQEMGFRCRSAKDIRNDYIRMISPVIEEVGLTLPSYDPW